MKGRVCSVVLKFGLIVWLFASVAQAQSIDISKFYYRDYLDFGQGYGAFNGENSGKANTSNGTTLTGKDGTQVSVPNVPNFSASSNYGSLTSVGRGFAVTANHVSSPESVPELTKWGLSNYKIANQPISDTSGEIYGTSKPYGRDEKFLRFDKYVVEGQVDMLDIDNTTSQTDKDSEKEKQNLERLKTELNNFKHTDGNVYLYQAGSGIIKLRGTSDYQGQINGAQNGETKGGGFGTLNETALQYAELVKCENCATGDNRGMVFNYNPDSNFNNRITSGDSGSGIYAYDKTKNKWVLLGVVSQTYEQLGQNEAKISFVSNKDLQDYQKNFEQNINLKMTEPNLNKWMLNNTTLEYDARGDTPNGYHALQNNKDIIFSGGGTIEVQANIYRNISGYAGGFVFTADSSATSAKPTRYIFTNKDNKANIFIGSGLDIGQNVVVEWALGTQNGDSLHKIGKGELIIKTQNVDSTKLGTLKIGEGKVTLDTTTKAFDNIYITSGRGELALKAGKAEALGAEKNGVNSVSGTTSANSYKLAQDSTDKMGFYFGTGGGKLDLAGNSLVLNTIAANDSKAIITNSDASTQSTLEIQGLGYGTNGTKTSAKADTIIHASFGEISPSPAEGDKGGGSNTQNSGQANINIKYSGNRTTQNVQNPTLPLAPSAREGESQSASLIFDGHINIKGKLEATNGNIVLQGHPTTHATISDKSIRDKIQNAEKGTSAAMPNYMDLSKPSNLQQPDWDSRNFTIGSGITLTNTTLTVGKAAHLKADINADKDSQINFGGRHFIDSKDGKNVIGSGFSYQQGVTSDELKDESYKDSSYSGTIKAIGTTITSKFMNFAPNLELKSGAKLNAKHLTLTQSSTMNLTNSTAKVENLIFKGFQNGNDFSNKFTLDGTSTFSVTQALSFDNSTFDLKNLSNTKTGLTLPTEYNLYAFNGSKITATNEFKNTKDNAEFVLDGQSTTFNATNAVSFKSAKMSVQNEAEFTADSLKFDAKSTIDLTNSAKFTLTKDLQTQDLNLNLLNSSTMSAKSLTSNGASTINLNNKAELTLTDILTSKDLTLTLKNESKFTANTLTASGVVKLQGDKNATLTLDTLTLDNAQANISAKADIKNLTLNNTKETAIGENVSITTLNLNQSNANLKLLNGQIPKTINLNTQSNLYLNELNLNTNSITLTSDDSSKAHIQRLIYDAKSTQNGAKTAPQSNLSVSELFKLDNVGTNLGTNSEQDRLNKDLLALEFGKTLTLQSSATLEVNFAELIKHNNSNLQFDKSYTIFSAKDLSYNDFSNIKLNFFGTNGDKLFATGKFQDNAFLVEFRRDDPRNFGNLNPHIKNPAHLPLLEILLQHNKNDESIEKVVNSGDYTALNQRLAQIDTSLKTIANADSAALKTLSLLQKQEINARIQQNRFTTAKFALAKITNPAQKSDIVPTLLYLDENERQNRVWSGASASFFGNGSDKFSLQSVSIGYDRKLFGDEFLLGILASLTNTQLSSDETSLNPKIYTLALYSDALFRQGELQNELSFSLLNGDKGFESENGSYKSFYGFFESVYKVQTAFLPQSIKPIVLGRVNLRHFDEFSTATYKQKADDDISVDLGVGVEWLWQRESGFYSASFVAERDIYHSQKERLMSLTGAQKFVAYETNEPSFAYQLYLAGLESFKNGIYLRYGLSGFVDSKAYKGFKADVQVGYRF